MAMVGRMVVEFVSGDNTDDTAKDASGGLLSLSMGVSADVTAFHRFGPV